MPITDVVRGNGDAAPRGLATRLGWFVVIWGLSTMAFMGAAALLRLMIPR
jgi:Protein of unknown function (DUF2474)